MSPESRSQMRAASQDRLLCATRRTTALATFLLLGVSQAVAAPLTTIASLQVNERGEATVIELEATHKPMFSVFKLERPARLTIDLANAQLKGVPAILDVESWAVSQVATTQFRTPAAAIARVMVNFRRPSHYALRTEGTRLIVTISALQPRPKNDPVAIKLALEGARKEAARARQDAESERKSASSALDAAGKAEKDAARARQQAVEAKRLAELSQKDTQRGQAELERARAQAARLKLDAEAARSLAQQRLDAVKAARTAAERERQQAEASRLLAEQQRKQSAATLAQLEQKRREAEAARLTAEKERREAAAAKAQALVARAEAERLKAEAASSKSEAQKQRQAAETQAAALAQAAKLSRDREAQVARLRAEVERARQLAMREAAGKQADAAAVGKRVRDLEGRLNRALGLARKAETARSETQRELGEAQARRETAEASRLVALARLQQEESRRKTAEKAKLDAEARAQLLGKAQHEVKARKAKLDEMTGKLGALQQALSAAESRERAVRARVATATEEAESSRQAARQAELSRARLAAEVQEARKRETTLVRETGKLRRDLDEQRRRAEAAGTVVAQLEKSAAQARSRLARQTDAALRSKLQAELARAEKELQSAERSRRAAEAARAELAANIQRSDRQQKSAASSLRQAEQQLADARSRASSTEQKLGIAERKLRESQKQLADSSRLRLAEEKRRLAAESSRLSEEKLLSQAELKRRGAERERDDAERKLKDVRGALEKVREARLSEERTLAQLKQAQLKASQDLASAKARRLSSESEARQLAAKEKGPRAEKAPHANIRDIRFVDGRETARIEIQLDGQASHRLHRENGNPVLTLAGARLPRLLQRTLDASEFKGPIELVTSYAPDGGAAQVKVTLRDPSTPATLRQEGQKLVWEFAKLKLAKAAPFAAGPGRAGTDETVAYNPTQVAPARARRRTAAQNVRRYSGRRIDLDFKDADIHNILRLLTDVGNVNIITSDNVQGRVTIRMKNVPWDQALDVILRAKGFGQVREGNLIRVAPASDLEKEREAEIARMKQVQLLRPLETRLIPLSYAQASGILDKLKYTMSPRGALTHDGRTNMVIARDIAGNLDLMERLIRNLDTQTPQVLIEARIIEARTNYSKEIGIQWGGSFVASQATGNSTGLVFPNTLGIGGGATDGNAPLAGLNPTPANPAFVVNMPASTGTGRGGAIGLTLGSVSGNININLRLSAAEANGDIRIVSAPKITTMDNVEARIEQGVTIPFSQVSAAGVQTTFQDAKLSLTVKPHVTADGSVIMTVQVTRNEPDFANTGPRGEPTILRKEAKTEMLVKDGDTSVIGGIYTTRTGRNYQRVPWFADIPILGWFFRQTRETADREEVLVFITPRIINRAQSIGR